MERPLFKNMDVRPPLVCSLSDAGEADTICTMRNAAFDGADGFLLHLEKLAPECQNKETLERIFNFAASRPVLTVNYRYDNPAITDDQRAQLQLDAVDAGASCCDIMADYFGPSPFELAVDPAVIQKQKDLIGEIHKRGAQVMMSAHLWEFMVHEQLIPQALEMESRGADIVKIAMLISSEEELLEGIQETVLLRKALHVPFLHIMMGQYGKVHRVIAPTLGSCMVLCVQKYTPAGHKDKPLLRATREVYNNLDYKRKREGIL